MALDEQKKAKQKVPDENRVPKKLRPSFLDFLAGETKSFKVDLTPYLPQELIGGFVPHVPGMEDEAVWNAASQACGTEKVNYVFSIEENRVWYLACPSSSLASNPDSWCPLAAALPGNSEFWDKETVYLFEQDGLASALRWNPETNRMQVFLGASRTILPRVQSMDANFVTINPTVADPVPWNNRSLKTEKLSRAVVKTLVLSGLATGLVVASVLAFNIFSLGYVKANLQEVKQKTDEAALKLVESASLVMQSDTIRHMVRIQDLLDSLALSNGYLVRYEVYGGKVEWEAVVPQGLANTALDATILVDASSGRLQRYKAKVLGKEEGDQVRLVGKK